MRKVYWKNSMNNGQNNRRPSNGYNAQRYIDNEKIQHDRQNRQPQRNVGQMPRSRAYPARQARPQGSPYYSAGVRFDGADRSRYGKQGKNGAAYAVLAVLTLVIVVSLVSIIHSCSRKGENPADSGASSDTEISTTEAAIGGTETDDDGINVIDKQDGKTRICVDPGHGYDDVGAQSDFLGSKDEKDINLEVANKLVLLLEYEGYDVIMTRDSDTPPSTLKPNSNGQYLINPKWRADFANKNDVDMYISLHCNTYDDSSVSGTRLYYYDAHAYPSSVLASKLSSAMAGTFNIAAPKAIGLAEDAAYAVTKRVEAPSVLIEMGFITNKSDAEKLLDGEWQSKLARSIVRGVNDYFSENAKK